ncbi:uncharacterized protein LOC125505030 [Dendroctonus ponderosae]|uniref:uncharacterized protein LOC125505030 n=1 Tax=Dendroctonus ponderosae TaxID=77166 RepID=UPI0020357837|nr:uncharacterized protein LOC125505030 [Dendroctonus ponderosae]
MDMPKDGKSVHEETDQTELDFLRNPPEKRSRFQVNRVRTDSYNNYERHVPNKIIEDNSSDDDVFSTTDRTRLSLSYTQKHSRPLTREALPRLDNYRNIMSLQAANRPTLDELHTCNLPSVSEITKNILLFIRNLI